MYNKTVLTLALLLTWGLSYAQVDLVNKVINNKSEQASSGFHFTTVVNAETTPVENQGASGTCWSYSTNSFLESEMIKAGKQPVPLSKIYTARCSYIDKAENYVRMHGSLNWGDGGEPHDVVNMYAKYGTMPESVYTGLHYGTKHNNFGEMQEILKGMLDAVVKNKNGTLTPAWKKAFTAVLDSYLGAVPEKFTYNGKDYTPDSFAKEVVGLNPDNYVEFISVTTSPYWQKAMMMVPDNWAFQQDWNIPMDDITKIIDHALKQGYTIAWGTDVSEPYFSWKNGVAYVPERDLAAMTSQEKAGLFNGPQPEMNITPELRQEAFDNYNTTDDHGMQITGIAKDQNGKEYYIVKNSWGTDNDHQGYLYVTKAFVAYKTTSFLVNKKGVPEDIRKKVGI
ncbi:aminopeptidase C [Compostibacter hankyongensis]|uniref:Aminopeptidase n=1 Tax=Compostibacter hankyongensis TaxID=1007089 RepID=A0ABP8G3E8_9BACT